MSKRARLAGLSKRLARLGFDPEAMMRSVTAMVNKPVRDQLKAKGLARETGKPPMNKFMACSVRSSLSLIMPAFGTNSARYTELLRE